MNQFSKYVGLDVHKETIAVAVAEGDGGEVRFAGEIANTPEAIHKLVRQIDKAGAKLSFCYQAGPCGYGIHRQLRGLGLDCLVVAPSLIPNLQLQSKQRLLAFLLRHGKRFTGRCDWTKAHYRWMQEVEFEQPSRYIVMQEYADTDTALTKRVKAFDGHIQSAATGSVFWPLIQALMALRGMNLLMATCFVAEIGDLTTVASAPQLTAYLGLVPSEHSSDAKQVRYGITKTGNGHVRRLLVSWRGSFGPSAKCHPNPIQTCEASHDQDAVCR